MVAAPTTSLVRVVVGSPIAFHSTCSSPKNPKMSQQELSTAASSVNHQTRLFQSRRRKVEFAATMQVNVLEQCNAEESATTTSGSSWYSSKDYAIFGKDVKKTVKYIRKGRSFLGLTGRGLEKYFSAQYHEEKKQRELSHYRCILGEQQRQRAEGSFNPKLLRILSTINSKWALQNALTLAKHDEAQASKSDDELQLHMTTSNESSARADESSTQISLSDTSEEWTSSAEYHPSVASGGLDLDEIETHDFQSH